MTKRSISALMFTILGVLVGALLISAALRIHATFTAYQVTTQARQLAEADQRIFDGLVAVRGERGTMRTALVTRDDPRAKLEAGQAATNKGCVEIVAAVAQAGNAEAAKVKDEMQRLCDSIRADTALVFTEAAKPKSERDLSHLNGWYDGITAAVRSATIAATAIANQTRMIDSTVAELVQARQLAWSTRDLYGTQCPTVRTGVLAGRPLNDAERATMAGARAVIKTNLTALTDLLARPEASAEVAKSAQAARQIVDSTQRKMDAVIATLDRGEPSGLTGGAWIDLCEEPFLPILDVSRSALQAGTHHLEEVNREALRDLVVSVVAFAVALGIAVAGGIIIRRRFGLPVAALMVAINRLSRRDFTTPVQQLRHGDEFGQMAAALETLRDSAATAENLSAEQETRRQAELSRANRIEALCRNFDTIAERVLAGLGQSASQLSGVTVEMQSLATDSSDRAGLVAAAANRATGNVQTVATAAEQLSASIREISQRVQASATDAQQAASQAAKTNLVIEELSAAAQRIGEVVSLINDIAGQTNLLALNATIEAPRAGDAGKGFAVVANEVKNLANQTGRATGDISRQVADIQATTGNVVQAIRAVTEAIGGISQGAAAIAAAVEQQGAATQEISRNVTLAAQGTEEVSETIGTVAQSSQKTGVSAKAVLQSVDGMAAEIKGLHQEVVAFLSDVQSA